MALIDDITGAPFALTALGRYAEFELNVIESFAFTGMADDFSVRHAVAYTNNHDG